MQPRRRGGSNKHHRAERWNQQRHVWLRSRTPPHCSSQHGRSCNRSAAGRRSSGRWGQTLPPVRNPFCTFQCAQLLQVPFSNLFPVCLRPLRMLGISKGSSKALCFVIDTTKSMSDDIEEVKRVTSSIISSEVGTENEPSTYILVPFSDPGWTIGKFYV